MTRKEVNRLGLIGATSYIIGSVIGSGIFVSPKGILEHTGSVGLSLIIWVASAVLASLTAINYIELGTSIPESGAEFAYVSYVVLTALLNMFSLSRVAARIQMASMVAKIAALIMIIVIGLYFMIFKGYTQHFSTEYAFKGSDWSPAQIVLALYQGNWAYGGYTILNYGMEDIQIKNFKRTVPLAVIFGLFVSAGVYVLANVAYFAVLTPQEILNSSAVATVSDCSVSLLLVYQRQIQGVFTMMALKMYTRSLKTDGNSVFEEAKLPASRSLLCQFG
ncbi:hypothetical protein ANCDUO_06377 [Ancylostoma duodenale]|uniref:Amino acid permease n=1 Tax=Ancylostoma duodenale TaxID=51022 RepID=A0A0C2H1Q2_9BILA|nr:hypothetical protein ANCDUO_06377 [Ancylostoma duodenale]